MKQLDVEPGGTQQVEFRDSVLLLEAQDELLTGSVDRRDLVEPWQT